MRYAVLLLFCLLTACASQSPRTEDKTPALTLGPEKPLLLASTEPVPDVQDDEALFQDDWETLGEDESAQTLSMPDPLESFNRAMFSVNDKLYFWVLKPVARGYRAVTPQFLRTGVLNFFNNLLTPLRLVNCILQGKGRAAEAEIAKFIFNSTVGVLGFGNPAQKYPELNPDSEDLGQTLGSYGIGNGFYIIWPVLGSSTLRDTVGLVGDAFLNPVNYVNPAEASYALSGYRTINNLSFRIGDYEALKKAALDPYEAMRNAYFQLRQSKIKK